MAGSSLWWWVIGLAAVVGFVWWRSTSAGRMRAPVGGAGARPDEDAPAPRRDDADGGDGGSGTDGHRDSL